MKRIIIQASSHNAACNLAGEAELIESPYSHILYLWENDPCVVIGRYQNPFDECDLKAMERDEVLLVRRNSGGGAVYHDRGNICFTIIRDREPRQQLKENFDFVIQVLGTLGIEATLSGRNDILVQGKKVSGNAFQYTKDRFCHHGTLLVGSNLSIMSRYLTPNKEKLESHAVKSVGSRVGNLKEFQPDITNEKVMEAFVQAFRKRYGATPLEAVDYEKKESTKTLAQHFSDKAILLKKTPPFSWKGSHRFSWGSVTVGLSVKEGVIMEADIATDCLDTSLVPEWEAMIKGKMFYGGSFHEEKETAETSDLCRYLADALPKRS